MSFIINIASQLQLHFPPDAMVVEDLDHIELPPDTMAVQDVDPIERRGELEIKSLANAVVEEMANPTLYTNFSIFLDSFRMNRTLLMKNATLDAADAESPLRPAELKVLRDQYEKEGEHVGVQTKFNYAWGLIKSSERKDQQAGVSLLTDIFRSEPPRRRECLYYLALGHYKLGNLADARRYNDLLLEKEPENLQADSLRSLIDDKVVKDGLYGAAIVGGVAVVLGVVGGLMAKGMRRR